MTFPMFVHIAIAIVLAVALYVAAWGTVRFGRMVTADTGTHCSGRHTYPWLRHRRTVTA